LTRQVRGSRDRDRQGRCGNQHLLHRVFLPLVSSVASRVMTSGDAFSDRRREWPVRQGKYDPVWRACIRIIFAQQQKIYVAFMDTAR
jgi:hypothetical protein